MEEVRIHVLLENSRRLLSVNGDFSLLCLLADLLRGPSLEPAPKREEIGGAPAVAREEEVQHG